jgi:hypothetical protein
MAPHPKMWQDDDPLVGRLRDICLAFPETVEVQAWGRPTWRAGKKMFAVFHASMDRPESVVFKPDADERKALLQDDRFFIPPYFGPSGWLALDFSAAEVEWDEVGELMDASYRQVALKRMIRALDSP